MVFFTVNSRETFIIVKVLNKEEASLSVFSGRVKLAAVCNIRSELFTIKAVTASSLVYASWS